MKNRLEKDSALKMADLAIARSCEFIRIFFGKIT